IGADLELEARAEPIAGRQRDVRDRAEAAAAGRRPGQVLVRAEQVAIDEAGPEGGAEAALEVDGRIEPDGLVLVEEGLLEALVELVALVQVEGAVDRRHRDLEREARQEQRTARDPAARRV